MSASALASPATYLHSFGHFERPTGLAIEESTGNVFVPESGEDFDTVNVFGERGGLPAGGAPAAFSGLNTPAKSFEFDRRWVGIAVDNSTSSAAGSIYVVDRGHAVVDRFKLSGGEFKYESQLTGKPGTPFTEPEGVATDASGDVYVSDPGADMVREFSPGGMTEIASFSATGLERSVVVDSRGDIFVYGDPSGGPLTGPGPAEIWRSSDTATTAEKVTEVPEVEGAGADGIDRATDIGYVAISGHVVEGFARPTPVRTGGEFGSGTLSTEIENIAVNEKTGAIYVADAGKERVFIYQGPPARFPLTVFITGEGEVTSTPAGLTCSTGECTHEFEGEVTLTAKAATGYTFGGWSGCKVASATTCTVDRTATTEVTAIFVKAGTEGPPGKEGAAGNEGKAGLTGPTGEKGATGAEGKTGPAGQVELVTCKKSGKRQKCTAKLVSGTVKFETAGATVQATLSRNGRVYAAGTANTTREHRSLRLAPLHKLLAGKYTLTLISGTGHHKRIHTESFTLN